ncbi:hypothetical protein [Streptomyces vinaceus]|uniref:hypothetical protein n=1 Tax=Streptomyces vinaceus TaxID=1960 RepID=UPI0036A98D04
MLLARTAATASAAPTTQVPDASASPVSGACLQQSFRSWYAGYYDCEVAGTAGVANRRWSSYACLSYPRYPGWWALWAA